MNSTSLMWLLADGAAKGLVVLTIAFLIVSAMPRASAAARHIVWLLAIVGLLALPAMSALLPAWRVLPTWSVHRAQTASPSAGEGRGEGDLPMPTAPDPVLGDVGSPPHP